MSLLAESIARAGQLGLTVHVELEDGDTVEGSVGEADSVRAVIDQRPVRLEDVKAMVIF